MNTWMYIITGIIAVNLLTFFNREARNKWKYFLWETPHRICENMEEKRGLNKIAYLLYSLLLFPLMLVFLLLVAPVATIDSLIRKNRKAQKQYEPTEKEDNQLYYWRMGGQGTISCYDCDYKEDIVSFIHSFDSRGNMSDGCSGYQCQSCGKFHALMDYEPLTCSCGGELSRDKPIFCPQCKSTHMKYHCNFIT